MLLRRNTPRHALRFLAKRNDLLFGDDDGNDRRLIHQHPVSISNAGLDGSQVDPKVF